MMPKERVVSKGPLKEKVNYPPHEEQQSEYNRQKLLEMELYPSDGVGVYPRSIPFKGSKEDFLRKTGRNRFDVFEYRFTAPNVKGEKKWWWVMWDYYNGLVRVHDFFDCCKPGKTEPGNAVREKVNPGLASVCHNITGGNLHAQGYWIPYEAAKALAAKFCYRIRYALTIIFGDSFPEQCLPEHHPEFGKYQIDAKIISACRQKSAAQLCIEQRRLRAAIHHHQHQPPPQQKTPSVTPNAAAVDPGASLLCFASTSSKSSSSSSSSSSSHSIAVVAEPPYPTTRRRKSLSPLPPPHSRSSSNQIYAQYRLRTRARTPPPPSPPPPPHLPPPLESLSSSPSSSTKRYFDPVRGIWTDGNSVQGRRGLDWENNRVANGGPQLLLPNQDAEQDRDTRASTNTFCTNNKSIADKQSPQQEAGKEQSLPPITPLLLHLPHPQAEASAHSYYRPGPQEPEPTPKRAKHTRVSAPPRFVLGTFSRGQRVCRSDSFSLSPPSSSISSGGRRGGGVKAEIQEEHVLAVEAAGNLMKLRLDEFNSGIGGSPAGGRKRRQSR
ncbi:hypothetical protein B9Z19DRAFT_750928 [Tuber borchii]|uniref:HTH APSES-type domain-containing protein n=1 Tax=Tuber borchii TaxID=42251 RepID=A0A2T7A7P8_TUBBO|nr:hypothetical protein B9Z19DRAFT_750928 [Tuber borchii]